MDSNENRSQKLEKRSKKKALLLLILSIPIIIEEIYINVNVFSSLLLIITLIIFLGMKSMWLTRAGNIMLILLIMHVPRYMWNMGETDISSRNLVTINVLFFLWLFIILMFALIIQSISKRRSSEYESFHHMIENLNMPSKLALRAMRQISVMYPIFMYFVITLTAIGIYANIYSANQEFSAWSEAYYFSASTYFTVGFGDILPQTELLRATTIMEMVSASVVNIVFVPLLISVFMKYMNIRMEKNNDNKKGARWF